ncbi:hypothetical protein AJ79_02988 [Helicocarpus griseus UAMH5409]|uniref:4-coumarate-CoA ligase n=1 Tax=Helicocarpus griseus UAMH5409 TaxID=1447875 RepID=A0A2B7XZX3_9EURO|nr:hypothetical protein AJ79_02988 [Helicocarpus griseus UAMH5409]
MPYKSRWSIPTPQQSIPTWIFESPSGTLDDQKPLLIDPTRPDSQYLTLAGYRLWAQRLAAGLKAAGLQPRDRVLLYSGNNIFFPVVFMGVIMAGGIFTAANPTFTRRELAYQLKDSGATFLLCNESQVTTGVEAAGDAGIPLSRVFIFDDCVFENSGRLLAGCRNWNSLIASEEVGRAYEWASLTGDGEANNITAVLNYSSGTTGSPKAVEITHQNYVANGYQWKHLAELDPEEAKVRHRLSYLCFVPMYHAMGQTIFCTIIPARRIPVYIMKKFDYKDMLQNIQRYRITDLALVPPIIVSLAKDPELRAGKYDISSIERVRCGAAPMGREVCEELESLWPDGKVNVKQAWGMTEATCSVIGWDPRRRSTNASVGELHANCEAKLVSDVDGETEVGRGERGELWVRGPNIMRGYWQREAETKATKTEDGWLKTGDIAYADENGYFFVVDRMKELIKVKGNQVAPAELEGLLLEHPLVADAAVIGVVINGEEVPRAYLVPRPGQKSALEVENVAKWMWSKVAPYKRLRGGVAIIDLIPKNPSGKILRRLLRDRAAEELKSNSFRARL